MAKRAASDLTVMASHHVDAGASAAPTLDGAGFHAEVIHAGQLDAVPIPVWTDVNDGQPSQDDMMCRAAV